MKSGKALHPQSHGWRHGLLFGTTRWRAAAGGGTTAPACIGVSSLLLGVQRCMEAPRESEGTAASWARPLTMKSGKALHPQSHG